MARKLTRKQAAAKGGRSTVRKHGKGHMRAIGRRGGAKVARVYKCGQHKGCR